MKKWFKLLGAFAISLSLLGVISSCDAGPVCKDYDFTSDLKFDKNSGRKYLETTVHAYRNGYNVDVPFSGCIDGDTVHFDIEKSTQFPDGIIKARFLCVDTPESTGQVQPWGAAAKKFTKEKLSNAESIIIESESNGWDKDSTGDRYLLYIWYQNEGGEYRNLNLELMQEGLASPKNITTTVYADYFNKALNNAQECSLKYWGEEDPDFPKGDATQVSIKALRTNPAEYLDKKVRFEGNVTYIAEHTVYAQDYDIDEDRWYGFQIYEGFKNYSDIIKVGRRISFCGYVQQYNDEYQLSGLSYFPLRPNHSDNLKDMGEGDVIATTVTASDLEDTANADKYIATYCKVENITVNSIYTTTSETDSNGAMTFTCTDKDNKTFKIRTSVLRHEDNTEEKYVASDFEGKTITCVGIMEKYGDDYQLHVYAYKDIEFVNNN